MLQVRAVCCRIHAEFPLFFWKARLHCTSRYSIERYPDFLPPLQFAYLAGNDPRWAWRAHIIKIVDAEAGQSLFTTSAGMDSSNLNFGHPQTRTTFTGYIPYLPDGEYSIYSPRQWNHICFAWSSGGKSKFVVNGRFTNVNFVDENLSALEVSTEFLLKVSLASCGHVPVEEQGSNSMS